MYLVINDIHILWQTDFLYTSLIYKCKLKSLPLAVDALFMFCWLCPGLPQADYPTGFQHFLGKLTLACQQISKQLSEEYERIVNPEKATEDTKPVKIKEEPVSDITFPVSEELEADLASGDQSLPMGVHRAQSERFPSNLEVEASPQASSKGNQLTHFDSGRSTNLSTSCILESNSGNGRAKVGIMGRRMESLKTNSASLIQIPAFSL